MKKSLKDYFEDKVEYESISARIPAPIRQKMNKIRLRSKKSWPKFLTACFEKIIQDEEAKT